MNNKQFVSRMTAVFSDIHSNFYAFKACYEDAVSKGADLLIFLGDYVSDLADPQKVLDFLYEIQQRHPTVCLRGNRERYMLECQSGIVSYSRGSKTGSLLYTYQQLREKDFDFFNGLPIYDEIKINGIPLEIAHAWKDDDRFYYEGTDKSTEAVLKKMKCHYFLSGHSHKQYVCRKNGKTLLNPGSIGVPRGYGHLSQYALLEFDGNAVNFVLRQIPYDVQSMIHRQFDSGLMDTAPHWAISVLYDVLTGEEHTMRLLNRLGKAAHDEQVWHKIAKEMGMKFTENEIVDFYENKHRIL